ncbi:MAG: hypothetical protein COV74_02960 [Candidatus Omnitrophica bacterium CG11_big_fil_rev_8_21_14_0_20_45_26]|uniref:Uncharacterized protein n=1 Tax=Candidatus Abzuiibacterium crystallinum TaxID=1974748 RepID=A0A2H0LRA7_9BACT|nr:MAG: hypothetical protein COV74_02960 [Candidatus Omnitrophica bacterium CG11_big_fil_rev_8_21_14_0_20_45_26]PIW65524.1 MAG: hypothetical protein COW12_01655 [Candidatus Omnitrophica bacterium CG12_big_fil_rev_8_21_14_0_65_45_16]
MTHHSPAKRFFSGLLTLTLTVTFIIQDMAGLHVMEAFAELPSGYTSYGSLGKIQNSQGPSQSFQTDLFTGRGQTGVSIFTPPGRGGLTPQVVLGYSSSGGNGWMGMGWSFEAGYIQRSIKEGVPTYNDQQDTFIFLVQGVSSELVETSTGEYYAKNESGAFLKFTYSGGYWIAYDKSGNQYTFGQTVQARATNSLGIFSWHLEKVRDLSGNTMTYTYWKDPRSLGHLYPSKIDYNGNEDVNPVFDPTHSVEFILEAEDRPDPIFSYNTGERVEIFKRLEKIEIKINGLLSRRYTLTYETSPNAEKLRLKEVEECGTDGQTCFPKKSFTYQNQELAFEADADYGPIDQAQGYPIYRYLYADNAEGVLSEMADMDGDGLLDRVWVNINTYTNHKWYVQRNTGNGFASAEEWPIDQLPIFPTYQYLSAYQGGVNAREGYYAMLIDFTGDGMVDRIYTDAKVAPSRLFMRRNLGNGSFGPQEEITGYTGFYEYTRYPRGFFNASGQARTTAELIDINGDGLLDRVVFNPATPTTWEVYPGDGASFGAMISWGPIERQLDFNKYIRASDPEGVRATLVDLNGDQLPDRIYTNFNVNQREWHIQFNNGKGFEPNFTYYVNYDVPSQNQNQYITTIVDKNIRTNLTDFNGDGLMDRVYNWNGDQGIWQLELGKGDGFASAIELSGMGGPTVPYQQVQGNELQSINHRMMNDLRDVNGDGLIDRYQYHTNSPTVAKLERAKGPYPDLLTQIDNGRGGITTIEYSPSTQFDNTDLSGLHRLPFPVQVVTKITQADGLGNSYVTKYGYKGGMYDAVDRVFQGFRETTVTEWTPSEGDGSQTIHTFHQEDERKGKTISVEVKDRFGSTFSQEVNTWIDDTSFHPEVHFVKLAQTDRTIYDENPNTSKQTRQRFIYDNYGNVSIQYDDGDIAISTDDRRTEHQYATNTGAYIVNALAVTTVYQDTEKIQEQYFYYDNHANLFDPPEKARLSKHKELPSDPDPAPITRVTSYDDFGNPLTIEDPLTNVTTNEYDNVLNLFLTKVTNHLGHTQTFTYDPLIAEITHSTDQNGQVTETQYDPLGRVTKVFSPLDPQTAPTQGIFYDDISIPNRVVTHVKTDPTINSFTLDDQPQTGYLTTYTFLDGLGREIEKRSPAEDVSQPFDRQIVSGVVTFDELGQTKEQYVSIFENFNAFYVPPSPETPHAIFTYDAVGRRTQIDYPDGTNSTVVFDDFERILKDQNGHRKRHTQDAYGSLAMVEECVNEIVSPTFFCEGGTIYTTTYQYDVLNRLSQTTDHLQNTTVATYDLLGRKRTMTDPDMGAWSYTYDENNNLKTQTDALNQTITFDYDALNRLIKKTYPDLTEITYTYDDCPPETCGGLIGENYPVGRLLKVSDASGIHLFRYDPLGRVTQDSKQVDDGKTYSFLRNYDALGRVTRLQYPDSEILDITFNGSGKTETMTLIHSATLPESILDNVDYSPSGQIIKIEYGNGVKTDYTYNTETLRLEHLFTSHVAHGTHQDLTYQFDNVGNVIGLTDEINTNTQYFQYDDLNRIKQAIGNYGPYDYIVDPIGNLTQKEGATLSYNDSNHPHAVTHYSGSTEIDYAYDVNGNMVVRGSEVLAYDYDNRLVTVSELTQAKGIYTYDAMGQRIKKVTNNKTTYYLGKDYEVEYTASGSLIRKAFFLGNTRVAEEEVFTPATTAGGPIETLAPESEASEGEINEYLGAPVPDPGPAPNHYLRWFHQDHLGSTNVVTNPQGQQVFLMEYLPFGEVKVRTGADPVTHTYTGHEEDFETDLVYANARYIDPKIGRFITPDTFVQEPSDPQTFNRYAYVRNNPIRFTDPSGHFLQFLGFIAQLVGIASIFGSAIASATGHDRAAKRFGTAAGIAGVVSLGTGALQTASTQASIQIATPTNPVDGQKISVFLEGSKVAENGAPSFLKGLGQKLTGASIIAKSFQIPQAYGGEPASNRAAGNERFESNRKSVSPYANPAPDILRHTADFSAGFGDTISFGVTEWIRGQWDDILGPGVVNKDSFSHRAGQAIGVAFDVVFAPVSYAELIGGWSSRVMVHGAHHTFGRLGKLKHIQVNYWKPGVKGSGRSFRIPLPWGE